MVDDLEYWQRILQNAEKHIEIMEARGIDDIRSRRAAQMSIDDAKTKIEELS